MDAMPWPHKIQCRLSCVDNCSGFLLGGARARVGLRANNHCRGTKDSRWVGMMTGAAERVAGGCNDPRGGSPRPVHTKHSILGHKHAKKKGKNIFIDSIMRRMKFHDIYPAL